jgi:hypothetical protein
MACALLLAACAASAERGDVCRAGRVVKFPEPAKRACRFRPAGEVVCVSGQCRAGGEVY